MYSGFSKAKHISKAPVYLPCCHTWWQNWPQNDVPAHILTLEIKYQEDMHAQEGEAPSPV